MFSSRLKWGSVFTALVVGLFWFDAQHRSGGYFAVLIALAVAAGVAECVKLIHPGISRGDTLLAAVAALCVVGADWVTITTPIARPEAWPIPTSFRREEFSLMVYGLLVATLLLRAVARDDPGRVPGVVATLFALLYIAFLLDFGIRLRCEFGLPAVIFLIAVNKIADTGAYAVGKTMGRHKLAPVVSPNKTVEGLVGGVLTATLAGVALWAAVRHWGWHGPAVRFRPRPVGLADLELWHVAVLSACCALAGELGDLAESAVKRHAGQKDSGTTLGPFGGIMDMVDCFTLSAPVTYYLWKMFAVLERG